MLPVKSRCRYGVVTSVAALAGLLGASHFARATAPNDQLIYTIDPNAGGTSFPITTTLYSAVEVVNSAGGYGTGSVINKYTANGNLYFEVLTAQHVVYSGAGKLLVNGNIGYGSPQNPAMLAAPQDPYQVVASGGPTGTEDMAVLAVNVGPVLNAVDLAFYTAMNPIDVTPYAVPNPYSQYALNFTQIGYGDTGTATNFGGVPGYTEVDPSGGTKRFQNGRVQAITTPTTLNYGPGGPYTYQAVEWFTSAPANNNGYGTSFPGDSGGPYLMAANSALTPSSVNVYGRAGGTVAIPIQNNDLFAIHTRGYSNAPGIKVNNSLNIGELITTTDANWIAGYVGNPTPVPEPAALGLTGIGGAALLLIRRRRKA